MATENNDTNQDEANYKTLQLAKLHMDAAHVINKAKRRMFERSREGTPLGKAAKTFQKEVETGLLELIPGTMYADPKPARAPLEREQELRDIGLDGSADTIAELRERVTELEAEIDRLTEDTQEEIQDVTESLCLDWLSIDALANEFIDDQDLNLTIVLLRRLQKLDEANDPKMDFTNYVSLLIPRLFRATEYCESIAGHYADAQDGKLRTKGGAA